MMLLPGCSWAAKSNIIEEISPTILLYVDRASDGQFKQSSFAPPPLRKEKKKVITGNAARLMKEGKNNMNLK
jgi:spore germination protein